MPTPLIPQELYLLERYSSFEYFAPIRDQWQAMVDHVEQCLEVFMERLPPDYRNRRLPYQPDIVWGERVLPNFRDTLQLLDRACINIKHGDLDALGAANGVTGDLRGVTMDYSPDWMGEPQVVDVMPNALERYWALIYAPQERASNVTHTHSRTWSAGDLSYYYDISRGTLDPPRRWPRYRLNPAVRIEHGQPITRSGIYLPDIENSCAALLVEGADWSDGMALIRWEEPADEDGNKLYKQPLPITEWRATGWTLIERVPGETIPFEEGLGPVDSKPLRSPGGTPCTRTGWWHTPANGGSRRYVQLGETLPEVEGSDYGDTFWLWSHDQSSPKL